MKKGWTITKLITVGAFGVLRVFLWVPFSAIFVTTGNYFVLIISLFLFSFISVFSLLVIRQFGTLTIQTFIEYMLELPIPSVVFKPLGIVLALIRSLIVDAIFYFLRKKEKLASLVSGGTNGYFLALFAFLTYLLLDIPGAENVPPIFFGPVGVILTLVIFPVGMAGGYLGYLIYQKIKNTTVVKRIQQ